MIVSNPVMLQPYGFIIYIMSTENKEEEKDILKLYNKYSKKIGIKNPFENDDGRNFESAFSWDWKQDNLVGCIYIRMKKITEEALDHELIHSLNCVNDTFGVSSKISNDESSAYFFTYMKHEILKILKENKIRIIRNRIKLATKSNNSKK